MKNLVQTIPFLRITIAFALGIFIAGNFNFPIYYLIGFIGLLLIVFFIVNIKYNFQLETITGWIIILLFILFGMFFSMKTNQKPTFFSNGSFSGIILETPEEKENSYKTIILLNYFFINNKVNKCNETILTYFEKNERIKNLNPGSEIVFTGQPGFVENNGNPYEFDYKTYLARKNIYRQIYLSDFYWKQTTKKYNSLLVLAENTREKLLKIYRSQNLGDDETEILSALTLGYKRGLDPETKRVFSSAGAMHVLAVSGLHVGIIFMVFTFLFGFLRRNSKGKFIFVILSILVLWGYAFITGLSPSVMRAASMFTLVSIGTNIQRRPNIYNSLAFAAFLLLLINPNNLYEVGFQLSFAAVFGIVFLQPRIAQLWQFRTRLVKYLWILLTVSLAAQIATFPFSSFYFSQFPSYFWLSNLIVIPAAFIMIFLGIGLLIFSQVPIIASIFAFFTKWVIHFTFLFLKEIENLPFAVIQIGVDTTQTILIGLIILFSFSFLSNKRIRALKTILICLLVLSGWSFYLQFQQLSKQELIAYNSTDNPVVHLIKGTENYIISETPIQSDDFITREIKSVITKKHLADPVFLNFSNMFVDNHLFLRNGVISFQGTMLMYSDYRLKQPNKINADFILTRQNNIPDNSNSGQKIKIIAFSKYPPNEPVNNVHYVKNMGAYHKILQQEQ